MKILVVDDDVFVGLLISLELPDVVVVEAGGVSEGYEQARLSRPDAMIIDRRLPDGDGLELVRRLRLTQTTARTPILLLTAGHDEADRDLVTRAGVDEYMPKPFEPIVLLERLERILKLPASDRKGRRAEIVVRLKRGLAPEVDLVDAERVIDLTLDERGVREGGGLLSRWRSRRS